MIFYIHRKCRSDTTLYEAFQINKIPGIKNKVKVNIFYI